MAQTRKGMTFWLSKTLSMPVAVTAVSNAVQAVVTAAGHGCLLGDVVLIESGWARVHRRAFEVAAVAGDAITLRMLNTTNVEFHAPGTGIGSLRKVVDWQQIIQVTDFSPSGGDPKKIEYEYLESEIAYSLNDGFSSTDYTIKVDADSLTTPGYLLAQDLTDTQADSVLKIRTKKGSNSYQPATVALNPNLQDGNGSILTNSIAFNGTNRVVRYPAA